MKRELTKPTGLFLVTNPNGVPANLIPKNKKI